MDARSKLVGKLHLWEILVSRQKTSKPTCITIDPSLQHPHGK